MPVAKDTEARRAEGARATRDPEDDLLSEADLAHWRRAAAGGDRVQTNLAWIILAKHEQAEAAILGRAQRAPDDRFDLRGVADRF